MDSLKQFNALLKRSPSSHKGDNGKVLVIGGSKNLIGAPILASVSALRVAADTVTLACPQEIGYACNCYCPDIMTIKLKGDFLKLSHYNQIVKHIDKYDAVLIGNGIGTDPSTKKLLQKLAKNRFFQSMPKVIDADAVKLLSLKKVHNAIFTPHEKEYQILLNNSKTRSISEIGDNIILLKGKVDQIISKTSTTLNKTGNSGMAKAGTGDVLAGLCVGILAKSKSLKKSAEAAAWLSGNIGDIMLKKKKGYFYIASDLLDELNNIRKLGKQRKTKKKKK